MKFLLLVFSCWLAAAALAAETPVLPAAKTVTFSVWGGGINEAVSQFSQQTGVTPLVSAVVSTAAPPSKIFLAAQNLPAEQALEWLARAAGCHYRLTAGGVYLTTGYEWLKDRRYGVIIRNVETLVGSERPSDRAEKLTRFARNLDELMKIVTLFEPLYRYRLEEHADGQIKLNAQVPAELKPLFMAALTALEASGETPVAAATPAPAEQALIDKLNATKVVVNYRQRPLREVLADLRTQCGLNIGFDTVGEPPLVTMELGEVNVQVALVAVAKQIGLRSVEMAAPNGVWLSREKRQWQRFPSRRQLWLDDVEVKCYGVAVAAGRGFDGEKFADWARQNVTPDIWRDPLASIFYHAPSGNLVVVAPPAAQQAVRNALGKGRIKN
ncbi:hypothetical protein FACS1894139_01110 [Planctomycetales bacterium]|nr:hypothetical protein FACS1894107_04140 [Planctomycetales bacterium]GHT02614.1 hypothetical protein FACS1894139_01110 [Planctomycetales bacterium]